MGNASSSQAPKFQHLVPFQTPLDTGLSFQNVQDANDNSKTTSWAYHTKQADIDSNVYRITS